MAKLLLLNVLNEGSVAHRDDLSPAGIKNSFDEEITCMLEILAGENQTPIYFQINTLSAIPSVNKVLGFKV